ncbi:MAG: Ger(x)C family spore germination protein, partial [Eubacteriales bacterium]
MIKKLCLITILIFNIFISGCWNKRELNQLAVVMGTGIDSTPDGQVSLTVQIVRPEQMKSESGGGGTQT